MKQIFLCFIFLAIAATSDGINWMTNYDQAVKEAKAKQMPLLLYFTGSEWCTWCKKLDSEALATPEFAQIAGDKFIFVMLNFSKGSKGEDSEQNKQLQKRFNVRGFPTLILLDPDQQQIGITGYRSGGGKEYANHLLKMVQDYSGYKEKMGTLEQKKASGAELKSLYEKANDYQRTEDIAAIIEKGMQSDESSFFKIEHLRRLAAEDKLDTKEAVALRQQLLENDPYNKHQTHYHLALIDFEAESTIDPLVAYIEKFGQSDKENYWKVSIIISQMLLDKSKYSEALKYARQSYEAAPEAHRADIAEAISEINSQIN